MEMEENKKHHQGEEKPGAKKERGAPVQPEQPVGNITSSDDSARLPDNKKDTPPDEQTMGNP